MPAQAVGRRSRLVFGLLLLAAALAAAAAGAPAGELPQPQAGARLLAIGDFGVGGAAQLQLGAAVRRFAAANGAQILVTLGDNDYTENPDQFVRNWQASFGWLGRARVRVSGVLGNHDVRVDGGRYQFRSLGMPGRYYTRRVRDVQLFLLDSTSIDAAQTAWLSRALARSRASWRIAAFHHPAFTCGKYRSHPEIVARWVPLFERYRVRLVLAGHDHNYQRFAPRRGVTYVVHGGGSSQHYALERCPAGYPLRVAGRTGQGFLYVVSGRTRLTGYAVDVAGRRTDRFVVRR